MKIKQRVVAARVDEEMYQKILEICDSERRDVSNLLRLWIERILISYKKGEV